MPRRNPVQESNWISFSDLMTGLMIIFMFIALNYIIQIIEHKFVEKDIYNAILEEFEKEIERKEIELAPDGTVRFNTEERNQELFHPGQPYFTRDFEKLLNTFVPRYLQIVSSEKYINFIKEIRIEGHADAFPPKNGMDSYTYNLSLSSARAQKVLLFVRKQDAYKSLPLETKERLDFLFTANGLSFSRSLNSQKELTYLSKDKAINPDLSRRVEFKVVTSNEKMAEEILNDTIQ
jgi:outer membrane protein OmpA-like peptidoglycan-associated protein